MMRPRGSARGELARAKVVGLAEETMGRKRMTRMARMTRRTKVTTTQSRRTRNMSSC
jgi:hypothetical protein